MPFDIALVFVVLLGCGVGTCLSAVTELDLGVTTTSNPDSQVSRDSAGDGSSARPIDKGLKPLYAMTNGFLDLVHPSSKDDWIDDPLFEKVFENGDFIGGVQIIYSSIRSNWKFWAGHYLGFVIVVTMGIIFVVAMPIVALIFCCCRLRGRCYAKPKRARNDSDRTKRVVLAILLVVLTTVMAAGVIATFMTNEVLRQQTSQQPKSYDVAGPNMGLLPALVSSLRRMETYILKTFDDFRNAIVTPIKNQVPLVRRRLLEFPEKARETLKSYLDPGQIFSDASSLSNSLKDIGADLVVVKAYLGSLSTLQSQLNVSLMQTKANILNALPSNCRSIGQCSQLMNKISNLNVTVDFSQSENASHQISNILSFIDRDFQSLIEDGKIQFKNMSDKMLNGTRETIRERVNSFLSELDEKLDKSLEVATKAVDETRTEIVTRLNLNNTITFLMQTASRPVQTYGNYRYYVGIGLSCVLLLIIACIYLGICFGVCGEAPGRDAPTCNRGVGASFLMAGIGLTFLFAWLLMSIAIALFVVGGASYTEVCRPALHQECKAFVKVGEKVLAYAMNGTNLNFTILSVLSDCENDKTIYKALNLEETLDVTTKLDQMRGFIEDSVNSISGRVQTNFSSVVIAKKEILDLLNRLRNITLSDFQFSSFNNSLSRPVTNANVTTLADDLLQFSQSSFLNHSQRLALSLESERLRNMSTTVVEPMKIKTEKFKEFLGNFKEKIAPRSESPTFVNKSQDLINSLTSTQEFIRANLSGLISDYLIKYIGEVANSSFVFLRAVKHEIQYNVGRCRGLYDVFRAVTVSTCTSFLSPFNGFWFSILWCLFLSVPSLILSVHLVALYRNTGEFVSVNGKNYNDPNRPLLMPPNRPNGTTDT